MSSDTMTREPPQPCAHACSHRNSRLPVWALEFASPTKAVFVVLTVLL